MIGRIAGKVLWGTTKFTVKYVVVPIAYTAALAYLMDKGADAIRERTPTVHIDAELQPAP